MTNPTVSIGISDSNRKKVAQELSHLLADTYLLYLKTQNFHWNVTGPHFYSYHLLLEHQYQELAQAADEIAERIRILGHPAPGSFAQFSKMACVEEETGVPEAGKMLKQLLGDHEILTKCGRELFQIATKAGDEDTADLMVQRMEAHEKAAWMLRSSLG
jgi:starvation-inducible DNA-binding protein